MCPVPGVAARNFLTRRLLWTFIIYISITYLYFFTITLIYSSVHIRGKVLEHNMLQLLERFGNGTLQFFTTGWNQWRIFRIFSWYIWKYIWASMCYVKSTHTYNDIGKKKFFKIWERGDEFVLLLTSTNFFSANNFFQSTYSKTAPNLTCIPPTKGHFIEMVLYGERFLKLFRVF